MSLLVLQQVHARDAEGPGGKARGAITELSIALGPGIHAVLGTPEDGTLALLSAAIGARAPRRGRVAVGGSDPARTPGLRARIGVLAAQPRLPPARSVGAAISFAQRARGEAGSRVGAVLDRFGLAALEARAVSSLSFAEARAVELALALTTPAPLLIALHEPRSDVALASPALVEAQVRELASAGACVVITTSSPADAGGLADRVHVLHRGFLLRETSGGARSLGHGGPAELTVWLGEPPRMGSPGGGPPASEGLRALGAALTGAPGVRGLSWHAPAASPALLSIKGDTAEACAEALIEAALQTGVLPLAMAEGAPDLPEVRATTEMLLRMHVGTSVRPPVPAPFRPAPAPYPASAPGSWLHAAGQGTSLPQPNVPIPVDHGGPLGRPRSVPAPPDPYGLGAPQAAPVLPAPPRTPRLAEVGLSTPAPAPAQAPSTNVNEGK